MPSELRLKFQYCLTSMAVETCLRLTLAVFSSLACNGDTSSTKASTGYVCVGRFRTPHVRPSLDTQPLLG